MAKKRIEVSTGWGPAIARLMKSNRLLRSQSALARASGVGQSTIRRILLELHNPQASTLELIAKAFGLTYSDLAVLSEREESRVAPPRTIAPGKLPKFVPLISWAQAKSLPQYLQTEHFADLTDWIVCPNKQRGPRTVAFKVMGQSMEPDYQPGDIIYVDPDAAAIHGKDVVLLNSSDKVTFRRLVVDEGSRYVRPLSPVCSNRIKQVPTTDQILGVVVGMYREK